MATYVLALLLAAGLVQGDIEEIGTGYKFTEGPVWLASGELLFSDIPADRIYKGDGTLFREPSGKSNGLTLDRQGRLLAAEHETRRVTRTEKDGTVTVLCDRFEGKRFNSPNDLVVRSDGVIFFTDPPYGLGGKEPEIGFNGVYALFPGGVVKVLAKDFNRPNGITLSPDESILYVADTEEKHIRAFDLDAEGRVSKGRIFCSLPNPDGIKTDVQGNIWATSDAVRVFAPDGTELQKIDFPQRPANCAFGGPDGKTLYVTARTSVYKIRTTVQGIHPAATKPTAAVVPKWGRYSIAFQNESWAGNPFDLRFRGVFTSPTGRTLTHWGFYGGNDTWKIFFMPDEVGAWTLTTESPDPELDGKTAVFQCSPSGLPGKLMPEGNRWRLSDAGGDAPVLWNPPMQDGVLRGFRERSADDPTVTEAIAFADEVVGARVLGFSALLIIPHGWAKDWTQEAVPFVIGREAEEFYLPFWDALNAKLDRVRDRGMGQYIMLYTDDELKPDRYGIKANSPEEQRFFRYAVARLACYPIVLWDSGIDIGEYRDNAWCNSFVDWFNTNDPWQHPTGSRSGGGSGGHLPENATYFSTGGAGLPTRGELLSFLEHDVPVAHTDHWRPYLNRGNWTHDKIRTVIWRCALSGGQAAFPDYNQGTPDWAGTLVGSAYIGHATRFFREAVHTDINTLSPSDDRILNGEHAILAANPGREYVLYDLDGGTVTLDLSAATAPLAAYWYNPRTGETTPAHMPDGSEVTFTSPTSGEGVDWVLHIHQRP